MLFRYHYLDWTPLRESLVIITDRNIIEERLLNYAPVEMNSVTAW
jgi:hypothetical protein